MIARLLLAVTLTLSSAPLSARTLGELAFTPCEITQAGGAGIARAECATLEVPENPQSKAGQGRRLQLAVTLLPARSGRPKPDLLTMLAGGPGQSAVDAYFSVQPVLDALRSDRHLLLLDQRGTGNSNRLACPLPDWTSEKELGPDEMRALARSCLKTYENRADVRWYTTSDAVRDLEALRVAVGAPPLNLIGGSYGTRVALEYLRRHPDAVRSVLIDGVVPPQLALLQDHARNLDEALQKLSARCGQDAACRSRYGDPLVTMRTLLQRLRQRPLVVDYLHPRTHEPRQQPLTASMVQGFIRLFSYGPESLSLLPLMVDEAAKGRPQALLAQVELIVGKLEDQLAHGMELSVTCAEDVPLLEKRAQDADTVLGNDIIDAVRAQCEVWPRGTMPADFKQPVISAKPVLILSGEFDPVTPPRYGDQVAKTLSNSRHLIAQGAGHIAMTRGCLPKLVKQFIADTKPRDLDVSCMDVMSPLPFFLGYEGPVP